MRREDKGDVTKYGFNEREQELNHIAQETESGYETSNKRQETDKRNVHQMNNKMDETNDHTKTKYQMHSNVTFLAKLAEKFPPKIRDYFLNSERPFLKKEGRERFFEYLQKSYPEQTEEFKYQMRLSYNFG